MYKKDLKRDTSFVLELDLEGGEKNNDLPASGDEASLQMNEEPGTETLSLLSLESAREENMSSEKMVMPPSQPLTLSEPASFSSGSLKLETANGETEKSDEISFPPENRLSELNQTSKKEALPLEQSQTSSFKREANRDGSFGEVTLSLADMDSGDLGLRIAEETTAVEEQHTFEERTREGSYTLNLSGFSDDDFSSVFSSSEAELSPESLDTISKIEHQESEHQMALDAPITSGESVLNLDLEVETESKVSLLEKTESQDSSNAPSLPIEEHRLASDSAPKEVKEEAPPLISNLEKNRPKPSKEKSKTSDQSDVVLGIAEKILKDVITGSSSDESEASNIFGISEKEVLELIDPPLERLGLQLERTIERFQATREGECQIANIYASGSISCQKSIADQLSRQISNTEAKISHLPLSENTDAKHFRDICDLEKDTYLPAIGMALSDLQDTPNFLYTYKERMIEKISKWMFRGTLVILGLSFLVCGGWLVSQKSKLSESQTRIDQLQAEVQATPRLLNQSSVNALVSIRNSYEKNISGYANKLIPLAVFKEIASITPRNIKLIKVNVDGENGNHVLIEGVIIARENILESKLVEYLFTFGKNPFFKRPVIRGKKVEQYNGKKVLRFIIHSKVNEHLE